jgi:F-type H+-transporting ATPase subunit delta
MAGRYATALFELARDSGELESTEAALAELETLLDESADLKRFVRSPVFSAQDQAHVITALVAKAGMNTLTSNFLQLLVKNRRLFALGDIVAGFRRLAAQSRGELTAEVTAAIPLSDAATQELVATLKAKTGKDIALRTEIDPSILGGLIVKIGSRMVDSSIRTKLNNLRLVMKEVG